jgi:hypothetical protein
MRGKPATLVAVCAVMAAAIGVTSYGVYSNNTKQGEFRPSENLEAASSSGFPHLTSPNVGVPTEATNFAAKIAVDDAWSLFAAAVRRKSFAEANELVEIVAELPLDKRLSLLETSRDIDMSMAEAKYFTTVLLALLRNQSAAETIQICDALIAEFEARWPGIDRLTDSRKTQYLACVEGKPNSVPERAGLVAVDIALVTVYLRVGESFPRGACNQHASVHYLFSKCVAEHWTSRAYLEPFLSAVIGIFRDRGDNGLSELAAAYESVEQLTPRLRWELHLHGQASQSMAELLSLLEEQSDPNDVIATLHAAFMAGVSVSDLIQILAPYLESRFGSRSAANYLTASMNSGLAQLPSEEWQKLATGAAEAFYSGDPASGITTVYFSIIRAAESVRRMKQLSGAAYHDVPDYSGATRILHSASNDRFRRALLEYWRVTAAGLGEGQLATNSPGSICLAAIESSATLEEAVDALESIVASCRRPDELRTLFLEHHFVLLACRGYYTEELHAERPIRRRLVALTETVIGVQPGTRQEPGGQTAKGRAISGILLADQLLAICSIEAPILLSETSGAALRAIVDDFKTVAFVMEGELSVIRKSLRKHEAPYTRVLERVRDERLVPSN